MEKIAVIGAGQMGAGIAQIAAQSGMQVYLSDLSVELADKGKAGIARQLNRLAEKGKITQADADAAVARIVPVAGYEAMADAELIIEAATEREDIKRIIFAEVSKVMGPDAILASNTSSISITRLGQATADPSRFVGMHFFNPVPLMPLLEIIRGIATSDRAASVAETFGQRTGKQTIIAADSPGFVVNRILLPLLNEAFFAVSENLASIPDIDKGVKLGLGHPQGPLELADMIGLDTLYNILKIFQEDTGDQKYRPAPVLAQYVAAGWLGRKTGRGFYDYSGDKPVPTR